MGGTRSGTDPVFWVPPVGDYDSACFCGVVGGGGRLVMWKWRSESWESPPGGRGKGPEAKTFRGARPGAGGSRWYWVGLLGGWGVLREVVLLVVG